MKTEDNSNGPMGARGEAVNNISSAEFLRRSAPKQLSDEINNVVMRHQLTHLHSALGEMTALAEAKTFRCTTLEDEVARLNEQIGATIVAKVATGDAQYDAAYTHGYKCGHDEKAAEHVDEMTSFNAKYRAQLEAAAALVDLNVQLRDTANQARVNTENLYRAARQQNDCDLLALRKQIVDLSERIVLLAETK